MNKVFIGQSVHEVDPTTGAPYGGTQTWVQPAQITTNAASATLLLAAGLARRSLIVANEHASVAVRIRFDGSDATSVTGIPLAAGASMIFGPGEVPAGKISGYSATASTIQVAYIA